MKILSHAQALTAGHLDTLKKRVGVVEQALGDVSAGKDQNLFIDFNIRPFVAPADWIFEPCASHYDNVCYNSPEPFDCPAHVLRSVGCGRRPCPEGGPTEQARQV